MNRKVLGVGMVMVLFSSLANAEDMTGVAHVVDGDTLRVDGRRVRLAGIDAPELGQLCSRAETAWFPGQEATQWLRSWIEGYEVICDASKMDRYGRWLATCRIGNYNINSELVRAGWVEAYKEYSVRYVVQESLARAARAGMWSGQCDRPSVWRRK